MFMDLGKTKSFFFKSVDISLKICYTIKVIKIQQEKEKLNVDWN